MKRTLLFTLSLTLAAGLQAPLSHAYGGILATYFSEGLPKTLGPQSLVVAAPQDGLAVPGAASSKPGHVPLAGANPHYAPWKGGLRVHLGFSPPGSTLRKTGRLPDTSGKSSSGSGKSSSDRGRKTPRKLGNTKNGRNGTTSGGRVTSGQNGCRGLSLVERIRRSPGGTWSSGH